MKISMVQKNGISTDVLQLISRLVDQVPWSARRRAMADVVQVLLAGKVRVGEEVFGWGRFTIELGMNELRTGIVCVNDLSVRCKPKTEEKHPKMMEDIRTIMDPECQADPQLRTTLAYTNKTASSVRAALLEMGWPESQIPHQRTISNILNRHSYRLRTVAKTRVQKKRHGPTTSSRTCIS
jgi:hypothetical protein